MNATLPNPKAWLILLVLLPLFFSGAGQTPEPPSLETLRNRLAALEQQVAVLDKTRYRPTLGEMMTTVQMRHAKLWFAGQARHGHLAAFELHELDETLEDLVRLYPTHKDAPHPLNQMLESVLDPALKQLQQALKTSDTAQFNSAYNALTLACNTCHQATAHGFIAVKQPGVNCFANQEFAPRLPVK